uniref:WW domain-containing protein n=1 Tax=Globisporangium ultimum (strain ATCC 200006 / CBS 805.95 / DAOM BR144) TaxID=431595 RepID=K3WU12_GLOUD
MPPKAAPVSSERVKKELLAQRARAEALKHLHTTGSGPSQSELARQQAERQKLVNVTSAKVQRFVNGAPQQQTAADKYDPRVRDNTLHVVAMRRANEIHQTQTIAQQVNAFRPGRPHGDSSGSAVDTSLPDGWNEAKDPTSGDTYYWNEKRRGTILGVV